MNWMPPTAIARLMIAVSGQTLSQLPDVAFKVLWICKLLLLTLGTTGSLRTRV